MGRFFIRAEGVGVVLHLPLVYAAAVPEEKEIVKQVPMPLGEIVIYPITKDELEQIEQGGPTSTIFAIMLALLGLGLGGLISILLTGPAPEKPGLHYMLAVVLVAVTLLVGVVLGVVWWRLPNPVKGTIEKVRARGNAPPAPTGGSSPPMLAAPPPAMPQVQVNVIEVGKDK